jgi:lipoprotein-anchoring transpeptidase ErfK/SrfK
MSTRRGWLLIALLALGIGLAGCGAAQSASPAKEKPAVVEAIAGKDVKSVTLTEQAGKRVGIETVEVTAADAAKTTVPYAAVLYTPDGATWVYVQTKPLTYVREKVVIADVIGAAKPVASLSDGPPAGTTVVTTGLYELYGAELGVGK